MDENTAEMGDCEEAPRNFNKPKQVSFMRRKELTKLAMMTADEIVNHGIQPHELRFFIGQLNDLLDNKSRCC